jgi:hypothetical protein
MLVRTTAYEAALFRYCIVALSYMYSYAGGNLDASFHGMRGISIDMVHTPWSWATDDERHLLDSGTDGEAMLERVCTALDSIYSLDVVES